MTLQRIKRSDRLHVVFRVCLAGLLCGFGLGEAQQKTSPSTRQPASGDIRAVNFGEFTYPSNCATANHEMRFGSRIRVSKGQWATGTDADRIYFGIVNNEVAYGDLTEDGTEEAAVHTSCGYEAGNEGYDEIFVFGMAGTTPRLLARVIPSEWDDLTGGVTGIEVKGRQLLVSYNAGGSHAEPAWIATARLQWNGRRFVRQGIDRKPFKR